MDSKIISSLKNPSLVLRTFSAFMSWEIWLFLALPLMLILMNDSWLFIDATCIDPWIYFGHFIDLKQHLNTFIGSYYGTRLPWILPGFLVYQLFSPLIAHYVLHLIYYYIAIISLYLILKNRIDRQAALLTTVFMGTYFFFLLAFGSNYIDGAGISYLLLTLLMLTFKENHPRTQLRLVLAGVFYGCVIYTQLFLIIYTPLLVFYYLFIRHGQKQLSLIHSFKYIMYGFVGISLILCTINYTLNGIFFFFMPIVSWTGNFVLTQNPWWIPISAFWGGAWWLIFPIVTFIGSVCVLVSKRNNQSLPGFRFLMVSQLFFIINFLMFVVLHLVAKQPVLGAHYSSYLIPAMFLALGSQLSMMVNNLYQRHFYLLIGFILALSFFAYAFPIDLRNFSIPFIMLLSLIIGITGLLFKTRSFQMVKVALVAISLTMISTLNFHLPDQGALRKQSFLFVIENAKSILSMDPENKAFFWYDSSDPSSLPFASFASINLWGYRLINEYFPKTSFEDNGPRRKPLLHDKIFLFSDKPNVLDEANKSLAELGLFGKCLNEKIIKQGNLSYIVTLIEIDQRVKN